MKAFLKAADYQLANNLRIQPRRKVSGFSVGEQRSPTAGGGIEFADYRDYAPGDELRRVDWNVFLRLRKLVVKLAAEEKELTLVVLLDTSASMGYGFPEKLWYARRLAAIAAGAAVHHGDRAAIALMRPDFLELLPPERAKSGLPELVHALSFLTAADPQSTGGAVAAGGSVVAGSQGQGAVSGGLLAARRFAARYGRKCLAVILSDFLYPDWAATISAFGASGAEILALQVLAPEELDPALSGESLFLDAEDGQETPLYVDAAVIDGYRLAMDAHCRQVKAACVRAGLAYGLAPSSGDPARLFRVELAGKSFIC
ncbi:MAG: hypothetical protein A2087_03965 [Spirochaetes bacterium GWD1_61_31]|nr:MAG: hypothetical protein A2Y37_04995 [Spirochaetes bacterium GWB1_60_80]OHD32486.1 MAG: hypothetical protein A2004_12190 [Spirochaetes bacterium GWC1_61_12]OHD42731.1 MAG: hypothetical protein A2087_03965 [Spirochaetes bacterium GWD1_61_31]OHD43731.1 MAG: hypothetical protein A2Y35_00185 [Spirochaetes bacterium GWE1_60_18]OHD60216.1 MAG: hypothetical protein A2Y32_07235 [Spirochaetes bacterium GWF1_60_12]HAW87206.1 hypothetical protein [Spirochaetaceae bacterium]